MIKTIFITSDNTQFEHYEDAIAYEQKQTHKRVEVVFHFHGTVSRQLSLPNTKNKYSPENIAYIQNYQEEYLDHDDIEWEFEKGEY